jgi:phosphoribosylglycinamide formyltransferase 1
MRIGILASHEGTTMQAVLDAAASGELPADVAVVISNNRDSGALRRAAAAGVASARLSSATHPEVDDLDRAILQTLEDARVDVVLLAGYMKKLGPRVLAAYRGRILNTHPALLPKFGGQGMYGNRVHEAVLAAGERETGASIHLVDAEYDTGRVIAQCRVPVLPDDTVDDVAARVQASEKRLLVETLARIAREGAA